MQPLPLQPTVDPSRSSGALAAALEAWAAAIGPENVVSDGPDLAQSEMATFATHQRVPAILRPQDVNAVEKCLAIANHYRVALHPRSSGRNWGYGSRVPVRDAVVIDLGRMNRIVEFDEELGHVSVEPGVTQRQLHEFLRARGSVLWMDATGSSPECSVVGNTVERGFGHTPYGDHFANVCALEVVLPDGRRLATGMARFENARAAPVYRWGVGPSLDGLFSQSNLGIVTRMTLWLMPRPTYFQAFSFSIDQDADLEALVDALRPLRLDRTIPSAVHIGNDVKILSSLMSQSPQRPAPPSLLSAEALDDFRREFGFGVWNGYGGLYGTRAQVAAARGAIRAALRGVADRVRFFDDRDMAWAARLARPYRWLTGRHLSQPLEFFKPVYELMQGTPTDRMIPSVYWRKLTLPATDRLNPDRDRCGLIWLPVVSPLGGAHARVMIDIVRQVFACHAFDPAVSMTLLGERSISNVIGISYDRDMAGEDARAMRCYEDLLQCLTRAGYYPYRLGIQSMGELRSTVGCHDELVAGIKRLVDPNGILSPGRYQPV